MALLFRCPLSVLYGDILSDHTAQHVANTVQKIQVTSIEMIIDSSVSSVDTTDFEFGAELQVTPVAVAEEMVANVDCSK